MTEYHIDKWGFLKQTNPQPFIYTSDYTARQGTTPEMASLRIDWVEANLRPLAGRKVLELGVGAGVLLRELKKICHADGFDVVDSDSDLTLEEATTNYYDCVFFCDVVEHFEDITHIFDFKFDYAYFSFPWTPKHLLSGYRHLKPNEHIYHLSPVPFEKLCNNYGYEIVAIGNVEDIIRTPWDKLLPNICSVAIKKASRP